MASRVVLSVLIADRVGVLRDISAAVTDLGANIDGISQTVVENYFTVILTATFPEEVRPDAVERAIAGRFPPGEAFVIVQPYDPSAKRLPVPDGDHYVVTMAGTDRPGILKAVTGCLAERGINIEDWYVHFEGKRVTHIGKIVVPLRLDTKVIQDELRDVVARLGFNVSLQHENIFRVTNEVGAVRSMLGGRCDA